MTRSDSEDSVDGFLERVKQLDADRVAQDEQRRRDLEDYMSKLNKSKYETSIEIVNPVSSSASAAVSESLQMDDLTYQSAYNYEKAGTSKHKQQQKYKKYDHIPEIIRFDDFRTEPRASKKTPPRVPPKNKFEISSEEKQEIDEKIQYLIGGSQRDGVQRNGGDWSVRKAIEDEAPLLPPRCNEQPREDEEQPALPPRRQVEQQQESPGRQVEQQKESPSRSQHTPEQEEDEEHPTLPPRQHQHQANTAPEEEAPTLPPRREDVKGKTWMNSLLQSEHKPDFELPKSKIKPIKPSKSNSLTENLRLIKQKQEQEEQKLNELKNLKLNSIAKKTSSPPAPPPKKNLVLNRTANRSPSPEHQTPAPALEVKLKPAKPKPVIPPKKPEFLTKQLSPTKLTPQSTSSSTGTAVPGTDSKPEALEVKLKPKQPVKPIPPKKPEALTKKLKPTVPAKKPALSVPEAIAQRSNLKQPPVKPKPIALKPEALQKLSNLRSTKPHSPAQSAPATVNKSNSSNDNGSNSSSSDSSKDISSNSKNKELELLLLKRINTDPLPMNPKPNSNKIQRSKTFDSEKLGTEKLQHTTTNRSKGPKRRKPKSLTT